MAAKRQTVAAEPPPEPARDGQTAPGDASSPDAAWQIPTGGFDTYREAAVHLRRPFTPEAIRFKVQSVFKHHSGPDKGKPKGCMIVGYIDARLVIERFNLVCPEHWSPHYREAAKFMWCDLTVYGITRADVGESPKGMSKDLVSDALKRAAVHFGVGVSLYAVPRIYLWADQIKNGNLEVRGSGEKTTVTLTDKGDAKIREGYAKWLSEYGAQKFGPPLDHGDREGQPDFVADADPDAEAMRAAADAEHAVREYQDQMKAGQA